MNRAALIGTLNALALAGLQAANIAGAVSDASGGGVPLATVALLNPVTAEKRSVATDGAGAFQFASLAAGQYLLQIDKAGFSPAYKLVTVDVDADLHTPVALSTAGMAQIAASRGNVTMPAPRPGTMRIRVGGSVQATNLIQKIQPVYPLDQKAQGIQGTVSMQADISREGVPVELTVLSTPGEQLAYSALDAVRQWRYRPTLLNGDPVEVTTRIDVNYTLAP